ncbi:hypothetical protein GCM10010401_12460 [Rarobacter faecitabidus]|uniref:hypothetical protein n=1 Tax=Rarobacter faecitabidus TaxID=13243 RepID=UPI00114EB936|nr:hypothetical protein [Rarobacter faecitabidus]
MLYSTQTRKGKNTLVYQLIAADGRVLKTSKWKNVNFALTATPVVAGNRLVWVDGETYWSGNSGKYVWFLYSVDIKNPAAPKF